MERLLTVILVILLTFSLVACSGNSKSAKIEPSDAGQVGKESTESKELKESKGQVEQAESPVQAVDQKGIICVGYKAYSDDRSKFDKYVLDQSHGHEIVSAALGLAMPDEMKIFNHLLPLEFMGESIKSLGKFDANMETIMFQTGWADDAELTYDQDTSYTVKGTDSDGTAMEIRVVYDGDSDSLRLEGYKDDTLDCVFEYIRTKDGYAAQYYFETITGYDKFTALEGFCTHRTIFDGTNGSCARFDNVDTEPASIFGSAPDAGSFIEGATHWFTITDGSFTGNLNGEAF